MRLSVAIPVGTHTRRARRVEPHKTPEVWSEHRRTAEAADEINVDGSGNLPLRRTGEATAEAVTRRAA